MQSTLHQYKVLHNTKRTNSKWFKMRGIVELSQGNRWLCYGTWLALLEYWWLSTWHRWCILKMRRCSVRVDLLQSLTTRNIWLLI